MFHGVTSYLALKSVNDFASARKALEACKLTPTGRRRQEKTYGYHLGKRADGVAWVRETRDGSVAFRLYATDVVVWHKDDSVTIEAYGSVSTTSFSGRFLPNGLFTTSRGLIGFHRHTGGWDWRNTEYCRGSSPVHMTRTEAGGWEPVMADLECQPFTYLVVDRKAAREVVEGHDFAGFKGYLRLMTYHNVKIEHVKEDTDEALEALEAGDLRKAAAHLPKVARYAFGCKATPCCVQTSEANARPAWWQDQRIVTLGSIERLRQQLYVDNNVYVRQTATTMPRGKLGGIKARHSMLRKCGEHIPYLGG